MLGVAMSGRVWGCLVIALGCVGLMVSLANEQGELDLEDRQEVVGVLLVGNASGLQDNWGACMRSSTAASSSWSSSSISPLISPISRST